MYLKERQKVYWCKETLKQRATGKFCVSFWAAFIYSVKKWGSRGAKNLFPEVAAIFGPVKGPLLPLPYPHRSKVSSILRVSHTFRTDRSDIRKSIFELQMKFKTFWADFFRQIKMPVATLVYDIAKGLKAKFQVPKSKTAFLGIWNRKMAFWPKTHF